MKLLVIGSGGREHAIAWKLAQSPRVQTVYVAPGNGGTALDSRLENLQVANAEELAAFCVREKIAYTVVGPEAPLAAGIVDGFRARGLKIFGPTRAAAQLESSKAFSKDFMARHHIPTAAYATFEDAAAAHAYVDEHGAPIVVKADGLAAGKGVVVAQTADEAHAAIDDMLQANRYGVQHNAGRARVVIEEFLQGEEASFIVMVDGLHVLALASSQDHKRLLDGDNGPNTGGMGAYSPAPVVTPEVHARVMREIIQPTVKGMAADGIPVHRLSLRRADDRRPGPRQDAGIQLPHGRPGNPAHHGPPQERSFGGVREGHCRAARSGGTGVGPPHRPGRGARRAWLP
jgi:phosphoribosylamine--glycine ligase (EC 6.3.4.13)